MTIGTYIIMSFTSTKLFTFCIVYLKSLQKTTLSLKTEPRINMENNRFPCRMYVPLVKEKYDNIKPRIYALVAFELEFS